MRWLARVLVGVGLAVGGAAWAGPPLVCHRVEAGPPAGDLPFAARRAASAEAAVDEALAGLSSSTDPLVHVETIRQLAVVLAKQFLSESAERVRWHAALAERARGGDDLAEFDLGWAEAVEAQLDDDHDHDPARARRIAEAHADEPGYAFALLLLDLNRRGGFDRALVRAAALREEHPTLAAHVDALVARYGSGG